MASPKLAKERKKPERPHNWEDKTLRGQILRQTDDVRGRASWDWLRKGDLKKETEGFIMAAQEQALRTNATHILRPKLTNKRFIHSACSVERKKSLLPSVL